MRMPIQTLFCGFYSRDLRSFSNIHAVKNPSDENSISSHYTPGTIPRRLERIKNYRAGEPMRDFLGFSPLLSLGIFLPRSISRQNLVFHMVLLCAGLFFLLHLTIMPITYSALPVVVIAVDAL
jgi:hypothetical protein